MQKRMLLLALATPLLASPIAAQRGGGGGGIGPRGAPAPAGSPAFTMPTATRIRDEANVADLLIDKRKKLGLDAAALDSLKRLSTAINERNAPHLAVYDSTRTRMRAAMNGAGGPGGGQGGPPGGGRGEGGGEGRANPMRDAMRAIQAGREADIPVVLALVPEGRQEEAKKLIAEQAEDFQRSLAPRGPGGGAGGGRPPRP